MYAGGVTISKARVSRIVLLQYANVLLGAWMASRTPGRLRYSIKGVVFGMFAQLYCMR